MMAVYFYLSPTYYKSIEYGGGAHTHNARTAQWCALSTLNATLTAEYCVCVCHRYGGDAG